MTAAPRALTVLVVVTGAIGLVASIVLLIETFALLAEPTAAAWCDVNPFVGCSTSIGSAQGSLLGLPNPVLGIVFWTGALTVGLAMASGFRPKRWFAIGFLAAVTGAFALVVWFIVQSVFVIGVLCPWCMLTWAATIPLFLAVLLQSLSSSTLPSSPAIRRASGVLMEWIPLLTLAAYVAVAMVAQARLNLLSLLVR